MRVHKYQKGGRGNIANIKHITTVVYDNARKKWQNLLNKKQKKLNFGTSHLKYLC